MVSLFNFYIIPNLKNSTIVIIHVKTESNSLIMSVSDPKNSTIRKMEKGEDMRY